MSGGETQTSVHATAIIRGEFGVLILGPSGSGKSALALALMARAASMGTFSALIGDDRVFVRKANGRLIATGAASTAGRIERRMAGLISVAHEPSAIVRLAVELSPPGKSWPRMPEADDSLTIAQATLPRLALDSSQSRHEQALAVEERLGSLAAENRAGTGILLEHSAAVHKNKLPQTSLPG
jgi:serine kinase of HPr protein (carbohydrate metabolism regulator)